MLNAIKYAEQFATAVIYRDDNGDKMSVMALNAENLDYDVKNNTIKVDTNINGKSTSQSSIWAEESSPRRVPFPRCTGKELDIRLAIFMGKQVIERHAEPDNEDILLNDWFCALHIGNPKITYHINKVKIFKSGEYIRCIGPNKSTKYIVKLNCDLEVINDRVVGGRNQAIVQNENDIYLDYWVTMLNGTLVKKWEPEVGDIIWFDIETPAIAKILEEYKNDCKIELSNGNIMSQVKKSCLKPFIGVLPKYFW